MSLEVLSWLQSAHWTFYNISALLTHLKAVQWAAAVHTEDQTPHLHPSIHLQALMLQSTASSKSIYLLTSDYSGRFKRLGHVERDREGGLFAKTRLTLLYVQLWICYTGLAVFFLECLCSVAANLASSLQIESPSFHPGLQFHRPSLQLQTHAGEILNLRPPGATDYLCKVNGRSR